MSNQRPTEYDLLIAGRWFVAILFLMALALLLAMRGCEPRNLPPPAEPYQLDSIQDPGATGYGYSISKP